MKKEGCEGSVQDKEEGPGGGVRDMRKKRGQGSDFQGAGGGGS